VSDSAIVIGAGIIGTSIAWRLAQQGLRVTLIDAGKAGGEASWAGAGMLAPGGEISQWNHWAEFTLHSHSLYSNFVDELRQESGCSIDYVQNGAIEIAETEAEWIALNDRAERQRGWGILSTAVPYKDTAGALFFPEDAIVDPREVLQSLLAACRSRGVILHEGLPATAIHAEADSLTVETPTGRISADVGVLAAGAWSGAIPLDSGRLPGSFPVRGHLIGYRIEPGVCRTILRNGETYLLQRSNGFLIAGTSTENAGFDRNIDPAIVADIARRAESLLPRLRDAAAPEAWLGFRPRADAHQPQIGRFAGSNLWLAYGHYRNGILLAPATAERVSGQITSTEGMDSISPAGNL